MRCLRHVVLSAAPLLAAWAYPSDASACGGCFVPQTENTQVNGHRMVLSISKDATTLYDQIEYSGEPSSFAWVLPIRGQAKVGLSSDALFATLDTMTQVTVQAPPLQCSFAATAATPQSAPGLGEADHTANGSVTVLVQEVVGPYETVQLKASDPNALQNWLTGHGYAIPPEMAPILASYVAQSFDFLALRLVPGKDVHAMRPVRVTTDGVGTVLPLKMVAAGTGTSTPVKLWILGEGRYGPAAAPTFTIEPGEVVWDFDTASSNYKLLRKQKIEASAGHAWQVESAEPFPWFSLQMSVVGLADSDPVGSGYADADGQGAVTAALTDVNMLLGSTDPSALWATRLYAELSRDALGADLVVGATELKAVERNVQTTRWRGTPPCTPVAADPTVAIEHNVARGGCDSSSPGADTSGSDDPAPEPSRRLEASGGGGCATSGGPSGASLAGSFVALVALVARRRRRR